MTCSPPWRSRSCPAAPPRAPRCSAAPRSSSCAWGRTSRSRCCRTNQRVPSLPAWVTAFCTARRWGTSGPSAPQKWREWDWLMGRLHGVAHLGHLLGADEDWIREQQRLVLAAEGSTLESVNETVTRLSQDFPPGAGRAAVTAMRDELNSTADGRVVLTAVVSRLVAVSGGVNPMLGNVVKAAAAADHTPGSRNLRWLRWVATRPGARSGEASCPVSHKAMHRPLRCRSGGPASSRPPSRSRLCSSPSRRARRPSA